MTPVLKLLLIIPTVIISSCGQEKTELPKEKSEGKYDKRKQLAILNVAEAEKLAKSFNANSGWDTTGRFTYYLQELFESDTRPVSFIGAIKDVIKKDTSYILKVVNTNSHSSKNYMAEIYVSVNTFQAMKSKLDPNKINEGCFIFELTKVSSHLPVLKSEIESSGDIVENASSYLTLDFDESLIKLEGKLVTYFLYDR